MTLDEPFALRNSYQILTPILNLGLRRIVSMGSGEKTQKNQVAKIILSQQLKDEK